MRILILIAIALATMCSISTSATAGPSEQKMEQNQIHDVGWDVSLNLNIVNIVKELNNQVLIEATENISQLQSFVLTPPDPGDILPVAVYQYERKRFISHNRKLNRFNKQLYGKSSIQAGYSSIYNKEYIPGNPIIDRPAWQRLIQSPPYTC